MTFRIVQKGSGAKRNLVICYYIGRYADHLIKSAVPETYCVINDTRTPTRRYTQLDTNMKTGIMPLKHVVKWVQQELDFTVNKIITGAYSAGAQAIRTLLVNAKTGEDYPVVTFVADGTHCSLSPQDWQIDYWKQYCNDAKQEKAIALFSHTQIIPPTFTGTRDTLRLITGFELIEKGTVTNPIVTKDGLCEVWSYAGANAQAHRIQAQIVFAQLLAKCVKLLGTDLSEILKYYPSGCNALSRRDLLSGVAGTGLGRLGVMGLADIPVKHVTENCKKPWRDSTKSLGVRALAFSLAEKANGVKEEPPRSNTSSRIIEYFSCATRIMDGEETKFRLKSGNWCAVAACFATKQSLMHSEKMPHGYRVSGVELVEDAIKKGNWHPAELIKNKKYKIRIGDLAVFDRSDSRSYTAWWRHVARVKTNVDDKGYFITLGGNERDNYRLTRQHINDPKFLGCIAYPQFLPTVYKSPPKATDESKPPKKKPEQSRVHHLITMLFKLFNNLLGR